jgi:hypothetical protein
VHASLYLIEHLNDQDEQQLLLRQARREILIIRKEKPIIYKEKLLF